MGCAGPTTAGVAAAAAADDDDGYSPTLPRRPRGDRDIAVYLL